mmetsp:Transcript_24520/g.70445  ORF Transcript_24520/g.70445 Transcript_24520/m.70445 type:complete len:277 (-) Transcript_24520:1507-2337(-)
MPKSPRRSKSSKSSAWSEASNHPRLHTATASARDPSCEARAFSHACTKSRMSSSSSGDRPRSACHQCRRASAPSAASSPCPTVGGAFGMMSQRSETVSCRAQSCTCWPEATCSGPSTWHACFQQCRLGCSAPLGRAWTPASQRRRGAVTSESSSSSSACQNHTTPLTAPSRTAWKGTSSCCCRTESGPTQARSSERTSTTLLMACQWCSCESMSSDKVPLWRPIASRPGTVLQCQKGSRGQSCTPPIGWISTVTNKAKIVRRRGTTADAAFGFKRC